MQVRFTLESHSVEGCFVGCISSTNLAYRSNIVIISEDVWSVEWFWLMCDWTCCILFSGLLLVNTWCCWRTSCGTRRLSKQTFSYKSMAWITSLRLGEWTFRWVEHGLWPYGGSQGHVDFFVCCLWGEVLVWFNIWKTKNTNIMSVVFELVFFWIRVSSCHPRVINPNWQAFVSRIPQPSLVSLWNDVGWMYRQWIFFDPRTMLGFGMLIMMIAATSGQTAFQQWPVWVEMLWLWTATGRDLIKIMEVFGYQLRYFQEIASRTI